MKNFSFLLLFVFLLAGCDKDITTQESELKTRHAPVSAMPRSTDESYLSVADTVYYTPGDRVIKFHISSKVYWEITDMDYGLDWSKIYMSIQELGGQGGDKTVTIQVTGNPDSRQRLDSILVSAYFNVNDDYPVAQKKVIFIRTAESLLPPGSNLNETPSPPAGGTPPPPPINCFNEYNSLGYGYDITGSCMSPDYARHQVIDIGRLRQAYPDEIDVMPVMTTRGEIVTGSTATEYCEKITRSANIDGTVKAYFGGTINKSFKTEYEYSSKYGIASYNLEICQKKISLIMNTDTLMHYLTRGFLADVNNLSPETIIEKYGTHVCLNIRTGARLQLMYRSATSSYKRTSVVESGLSVNVLSIFKMQTGSSSETSLAKQNTEQILSYETIGGDITKALVGSIEIGPTAPPQKIDIAPWQATCTAPNAALIGITSGGLIPIYEFVSVPKLRSALQRAVENYLDKHVFVSPAHKTYVYKYYGDHRRFFFTTDNTESRPQEGNYYMELPSRFYVYSYLSPPQGTVPLYRFVSTEESYARYFYTTDMNELPRGQYGYYYDRIVGYVYDAAKVPSDLSAVPLYKYAFPVNDPERRYYYTVDKNEMGPEGKDGYIPAGIACYVFINDN